MSRPVIGIIANNHIIHDDYETQAVGVMNIMAVREAAGGVPVMIPADPDAITVAEAMDACDGFVFTGGRPNVHPEEYGEAETPAHGEFDRARDGLCLPLIRALIAAGQPLLAICRGFQEMNVAMGGSLHPEIRDLPGRDNHRMPPEGTVAEKFALRHTVTMTEGGPFHRILGAREVVTNSLHGQGIKVAGDRIVIDGHAPDGTPEAIYVADAAGFAMGTQWHPEWNAVGDPVSRPLFAAFGQAAADWRAGVRPQIRKTA